MLEEAVANLKNGDADYEDKNEWSPQISLGMPVMIPEHYVPDLQLRMQLYRRLGDLTDIRDIDAAGAELIDRFGPLPEEVEALLKVILVKALCRQANVEKVDAGPKGAVITLRNNEFPNPAALVKLVSDPANQVRIKPDQKLVFARNWPTPNDTSQGRGSNSVPPGETGGKCVRERRAINPVPAIMLWQGVSVMLLPEFST